MLLIEKTYRFQEILVIVIQKTPTMKIEAR